MDLANIKIDEDRSTNGVWFAIDDTTQILVAREKNPNWTKAVTKLTRKHSIRPFSMYSSDDSVNDKFLVDVLVEGILLDWKGLTENGEEIPFSKSKAREILLDPAYVEFREAVENASRLFEQFRVQEVKKSVKKRRK